MGGGGGGVYDQGCTLMMCCGMEEVCVYVCVCVCMWLWVWMGV